MQIGHYKNRFPKMVPARNWDPQSPSQPTIALPLPKTGTAVDFVWPGMVLSVKQDGSAWQVGVPAGETPSVIAIAQDPTEGTQSQNVLMANSLVGLPCTGNFRICTPFFKRGVAYPTGTPLTYCKNSETINAGDGQPMKGAVRPAANGEPVIGYVVRSAAPENYATGNRGVANTEGAFAMQRSIDTAVDSMSNHLNAYFIEFDTAFQPVMPAAQE